MDRPSRSGPPSYESQTEEGNGALGKSRLAGYLVGWMTLSALALVAALVLYRPAGSDRAGPSRSPTPSRPPVPSGEHLTAGGSPRWVVRFFYTAVERFHDYGPEVEVSGCARPFCDGAPADLGRYPRDFVTVVRAQGSGQICYGPHAGRYLNWTEAAGYWLDTVPRSGNGVRLVRLVSADSGTPQLSVGTRIKILACGRPSRRGAGPICSRAQAAAWNVAQVSAPDPDRDVRLYIGREDCADFQARLSTFRRAVLRIG